ncbi:MAG TPA: helical backbone metal receptor [Anaerolineaceae bacterium]
MENNPLASDAWDDLIPAFETPPTRVVSLIPSVTETLFDLGLGGTLAGCTDFCTEPAQGVAKLARVGGPGDARLDEILALDPQLVVASREENNPLLVEDLRKRGIAVWVIFPRTVHHAFEILWGMAHLFASETAVYRILTLEPAYDWTHMAMSNNPSWRYFCPIWLAGEGEEPRRWMTINQDTYTSDLLKALGGINVFAERTRTPAGDTGLGERYPWVEEEEVRLAQPDVILLPSEPYAFGDAHRSLAAEAFIDTPAAQQGRIICLDGSLITWFGTRLARALDELPALLSFPGQGEEISRS